MNKRQAKKAFKKKYGYNPPKQIKPLSAKVKNWDGFRPALIFPDEMAEALSTSINLVSQGIRRMAEELGRFISDFRIKIQTMPEEEFNSWLESDELDDQQKGLLKLIRERGKINQ